MKFLRNEKGIECTGSKDKTILIRNGYFNLINGYKEPFVLSTKNDGKHIYMGKSSVTQFESVKNFDVELRMLLMRYLVQAEEEIRTVTGYKFDQVNNNGKTTWYDVTSYNDSLDVQSRIRVITKCFSEIDRSKQSYKEHYLKTHKEIPTWVFIKALNFSTFIDFFNICKPNVKSAVCNLYGIVSQDGLPDYNLMISMLHWMRKVRNSCAHNERIYGMNRQNGRVKRPFEIWLNGRNTYVNKHHSQRIIDAVVYLRYFLPDNEYQKFITEIERLLHNLQLQINKHVFSRVRAELGLRDFVDLAALKGSSKIIDYNKF